MAEPLPAPHLSTRDRRRLAAAAAAGNVHARAGEAILSRSRRREIEKITGWPNRRVRRFHHDLLRRGVAAVLDPATPGRPRRDGVRARRYSAVQVRRVEAGLRRRAVPRPGEPVETLAAIARRTGVGIEAIKKMRGRLGLQAPPRVRSEVLSLDAPLGGELTLADVLADPAARTDDVAVDDVVARLRADAIERMLGSISPRSRHIVTAHLGWNRPAMTFGEIAASMGLSERRVVILYRHALERCRRNALILGLPFVL